MNSLKIAVSIVVAMVVSSAACAVVTVQSSHPAETTHTAQLISGKWNITLQNFRTSGPVVFQIRGTSTDHVRHVLLNNHTSQTVQLDIQTSLGTSIGPIDLVDAISSGGTPGQNQILQLRSTGPVGNITINDIVQASITGNVTGDIVLLSDGGESTLNSLQIGGDLLGDVDVQDGPINSLVVGGDIGTPSTPVTIQTSQNIGQIVGGNVYADISTPNDRNVERLRVNGDFVGSLETANFAVTTDLTASPRGLSVTGDCDAVIELAGSFQLPATITGALTGSVTALTNSSGNAISVGSIPSGGEFWLKGFTSTTAALGAPLTVNGPIAGTLKFGRPSGVERGDINQNVTVSGPVSGMIRTYGNLSGGGVVLALNGGLTTTGQVFIGNTLGGTITLPAPGGGNPGLAGQIIINADDMSGTWNGQVKIGTGGGAIDIPTSPTSNFHGRYAHLPSTLGGGSIGLAPFQLHEEACTPIHDDPTPSLSSIFDPNAEPCGSDTPIVIRSYGPISKGDASTWMDAIVVEATMDGNDCGWVDVSMMFTALLSTDAAEGGRALVIKKANSSMKDPAKLRYRVVPRNGDDAVLSRDVLGMPEVDWPVNCASEPTEEEAYLFELVYDCNSNCVADSEDIVEEPELDMNENGVIDDCEDAACRACDVSDDQMLDLADLIEFLSPWQTLLGQMVTPGSPGDYNADGVVDLADLLDFLMCWNTYLGQPCE